MNENFTQILSNCQQGDEQALEKLFPIIYQELRSIAHRQLGNVWAVETICTTALVNEAYLKLAGSDKIVSHDRNHFFAIAAKAMRQILINYSKQKQTQKRGVEWQKTDSVDNLEQSDKNIDELIAIDRALTELEVIDPELSRLVELRFFAGMTETEVAKILGISDRSVRRNWQKAKVLLANAI
jgi:RNA polymerase sigma factor (TIGR02999 family)